MNISKLILTLCSICFVASSATAQQMGTSDAGRAENAALAIQLKNQKEAMEQLQKNLEEITSKINNSTTGLDAVREKITDPTTGLEKRIQDSEGRKPAIAIAHTYCSTVTASSCKLNCNNYSKHGDGSNNTASGIPYSVIRSNYNDPGYIQIMHTNMQYNYKTDPNPNSTDDDFRIIQVGGIDLDSGYTSANCRATRIERCAEYTRECVSKGTRGGCQDYGGKICTTWKKEYVPTTCEVTCGTIAYKKPTK